jgi:hypothetical protein
MSGEVFNDAMQMARQALTSNNFAAFETAIQQAQTAYPNHSAIRRHLQQASIHFPTAECLCSLSEACMIVANVEFNGETDAVPMAYVDYDERVTRSHITRDSGITHNSNSSL